MSIRWNQFIVVAAALLTFVSCGTSPSLQVADPSIPIPTSQITAASLEIQDVGFTFAERQQLGQSALPVQLWRSSESVKTLGRNSAPNDGLTIRFNDPLGVPFAYVTAVTRAPGEMTVQRLFALEAQQPRDAKGLFEEGKRPQKDWTLGTYVSGAGTNRLVLGRTMYGFPVLRGLYGNPAREAGVNGHVKDLVMPDNNNFWAILDDGRAWDLLLERIVTPTTIAEVKRNAERRAADAVTTTSLKQMQRGWGSLGSQVGAQVLPCAGTDCLEIKPQNITTTTDCYTWYFLWFPNTRCKNHYMVTLDQSRQYPARVLIPNTQSYTTTWDNDQTIRFFSPSTYRYSGCSPTAMTELLYWWHRYGGISTGRADYDANFQPIRVDYDAWQWEFRAAMGTGDVLLSTSNQSTYYAGGTSPFNVESGANIVFTGRGMPIRARSDLIDGLGISTQWRVAYLDRMKTNIKRVMGTNNQPMIINIYTSDGGHTAYVNTFDIDDDVLFPYTTLISPPSTSFQGSLVLGSSIGEGTIWLERI